MQIAVRHHKHSLYTENCDPGLGLSEFVKLNSLRQTTIWTRTCVAMHSTAYLQALGPSPFSLLLPVDMVPPNKPFQCCYNRAVPSLQLHVRLPFILFFCCFFFLFCCHCVFLPLSFSCGGSSSLQGNVLSLILFYFNASSNDKEWKCGFEKARQKTVQKRDH